MPNSGSSKTASKRLRTEEATRVLKSPWQEAQGPPRRGTAVQGRSEDPAFHSVLRESGPKSERGAEWMLGVSNPFAAARTSTRQEVYSLRLKGYRRYWNTRRPHSPEEKVAQDALRLVWPTVRATQPTQEEVDRGVWSRGPEPGPYRGRLPPPIYLNPDETHLGDDGVMPDLLARADGFAIMYDLDGWKKLPGRRFDTIIHEALHIVGFRHSLRGTGRPYQRVVSRAKKNLAPKVREQLREMGVIGR